MNFVTQACNYTRVTASGNTVLSSGRMVLERIVVPAVLTGQIVNLWAGNTAVTQVVGTCTLAANTNNQLSIDLPTGLTYAVTNEDVDLTIFWRPLP